MPLQSRDDLPRRYLAGVFTSPAWPDTYATLHMWTQIVGKIQLKLSPQVNHWWGAALQLCARGLTTLTMPHDAGAFEMTFDFCAHELQIRMNDTRMKTVKLESKSVAEFYAQTMAALADLGIAVKIWTMPVEIPVAIRFTEDTAHAIRCRGGKHLVARDGAKRRRYERIPGELRREIEPGAFLVGRVRSCGHTVQRKTRTRAARCRRDDEGSVLARGDQRRVLAGERDAERTGVLRLCGSGASRVQDGSRAASAGVLWRCGRRRRVLLEVRRGPYRSVAERGADGVPAVDLRRRRDARKLEPEGAGAMSDGACAHIESVTTVKHAKKRVCDECVKIGGQWVHLRTCQECGGTHCCDNSPNRHATKHAKATSHPVIASAEPGERWLYCYPDDAFAEY